MGGLGPILALGFLGVLAAALLMLRSTEYGLLALIALICVLPYAAVPIDIGFRPTFIDMALLAVFGVWLVRVVTGTQRTFEATSLGLPIFAFLIWTVMTFVAGLAHSPLNSTVLRRFMEVLLVVGLFFVIVNQVTTMRTLKRATAVLILTGGAAGFLGVLFYFLPGNWTVRILSKLAVFNYPSGAGILRFVEDDTSQPMRAIATSIDPNALGGLLIIVTAVAMVQFISDRPVLPRKILAPLAGFMALSLVLTYSRGSMAGLVAGLLLVGALRYRKLLWLMVAGAVLMLILPQTQAYVIRLIQGLRGEDLATQMRFGEYKDALILISRYPILGVGFTGTPDIDIYLGVSSLYLLIAEQVGLVGLFLYLTVIVTFFVLVLRSWRRMPAGHEAEGYLLAYVAALSGALVGGVFDHFFFNINFIHLVSLFWLVVGLGVASARIAVSAQPDSSLPSPNQTV
jgi:O-antigen ligase